MKSRLFASVILLSALVGIALLSCESLAADKPIELKMNIQRFPPDSTFTKTANHWAEMVRKATEGKIEIKIFLETLAKGPDSFSAAQQGGIVDITQLVCSFISPRVKGVAALELPGAYPADRFPEVAEKIRPVMSKIMDAQGIKYLGVQYTDSALVVASRKKHYVKPEDMKGEKIRIPGMWMTKALEVWGASPTMILPPEMYNAMQTGVVDACGSILDLVALLKLYEVGPYVTEWPNTTIAMMMFGMNKNKFNGLDKNYQEILLKTAKEAERFSFEYGVEKEKKTWDLISPNIKRRALTKEEVQVWMKSVLPVYKDARSYSGPEGNQLIDIFDEMMNRDTR
ncbi:MAG: TRAP transporter substrate-binding protein DctP [Desulfomonilaceae bacterium]|nr:TRAP transporter substrate-binding protein DctP [Desulfomonilaceae bacterium]